MQSRQNYIIYDLPLLSCKTVAGWAKKTIGEIADVVGGGTPDTGVDAFWQPAEILWVTPTEITIESRINNCQRDEARER
jgi:type I restriction enzyme S subunit